jgi:hypothetical protein
MIMEFKDFYWMHRTAFLAGGGAVMALLLIQTGMVLWTTWRLRELSHMRERLSRLADGLALLTDTTEAGLAAMARELQQPAGKRVAAPRTESRASVNKRVVSAARKGAQLAHIAQNEALSESEVRLHLKLAEARLRESQLAAAAR